MSVESRQRRTPNHEASLADLRRRAEEDVSRVRRILPALAQEDLEGLLYELQVHQIELEMQCRQLQESQCETEESRNNYRDLYESIPIGFTTIDASGGLRDINPAGALLLRLPGGSLPNFHVFVATKDLDRFDLLCRDVLAKDRARTAELALERMDGETLAAEVGIYPVRSSGARATLRLTFQDVSRRTRAEETVRAQQAQLERERKELEVLSGHLNGAERERLQQISARLFRLIQDVPDFTSEHALSDCRVVELISSMRRYIEELSALTGLPIGFRESNVRGQIPQPVRDCIFGMMQESLANVVKHAAAKRAAVTLTGLGQQVEVRVVDDGRGFDLTQVLQTQKGRGLVTIQEHVRQLGGKIVIQSRPGKGAELRMCLPASLLSDTLAKAC